MSKIRDITQLKYSVGDIFAVGWNVFSRNFVHYVILVLIVYLPILIAMQFLPVDLIFEKYGMDGVFYLDLLIRIILPFILGISTMAIAISTHSYVTSQSVDLYGDLKSAIYRWPSFIGTSILAGLIVTIGFMLLIVPGIFYFVNYSFFVYVVALRRLGGKSALDYSKHLVEGQWGRVLGITFLLGICLLLISYPVNLLIGLLPQGYISLVLGEIIGRIFGAYFSVTWAIFFLNTDFLKHLEDKEEPLSEIVAS
jgi:hypothetical protein